MANAFDLGGLLELDSSDFVSSADDASSASTDIAQATDDASGSLTDIKPAGVAAGAGLAAVGKGAQSVLDKTQGMRETLGRTSQTMGVSADEANRLARSMSNATFPIDDTVATMDELATQGVTTKQQMREVATAADMVADATGSTAESIASSAGPALRAMGEDVTDLNEHMDTFTFISRNTTMSVEGFSKTVRKVGPEIEEMGLSVDDTAAILAALEEKGMDSRTAMREFRQAANDAEGDQQKLMQSLNLSSDALDQQRSALEKAQGSTKEHAEAANESLSTMDRLRAKFDDVKLAAGNLLGPISAVAPAMQAAGVAAMTFSTINTSAVVPSLTAVMASLGPLLPVIAGLTAASAALYGAWKTDFLGVRTVVTDAAGSVMGKLEPVASFLEGRVPTSVGEFEGSITGGFNRAETVITNFSSSARSRLQPLFSWLGRVNSKFVDPMRVEFTKTWDSIEGRLRAFGNWARPYLDSFFGGIDTVTTSTLGRLDSLWQSHGDTVTMVVDATFGTAATIVEQQIDVVTTVVKSGLALIRGDTEAFKEAWIGLFDRTIGRVVGLFEGLKETLVGNSIVPDMLDQMNSVVSDGLGAIVDKVRSWNPASAVSDKADAMIDALPSPADAREAAKGFTDAFASKIEDGKSKVTGAVDSVTDKAGEYLPGSDAEKGAFSHLTDAGAAIPETIGGSAEKNATSLSDSLGSVTEAAAEGAGRVKQSVSSSSGEGGGGDRDDARVEELLERIAAALEGERIEVEGELQVDGRRLNDLIDARLRKAGREV